MKIFEPHNMRFTVDICGIGKDGTENFLFKFIPSIYGYIKDLFHPCPYEKVTIQ
jgi:hypothetical protein